jgi:hypothetical protein
LRVIEGFDFYDSIIAVEICLMPYVVITKKFKVLEFVKYMGLECPNTHLRSNCNKMMEVILDEKFLIHFF